MDFKLKTSVLRNCLVLMRRLAGWLSLKDTSQCKWQAVYVWWMLSTSWFIVVFSGCQPRRMYRNWKQCRNNVSAQQVLWTSTMGRDLRLMWTEVGGQILHNSVDVRNEWALCGVGKHCSDPVSRLNLLAGTALAPGYKAGSWLYPTHDVGNFFTGTLSAGRQGLCSVYPRRPLCANAVCIVTVTEEFAISHLKNTGDTIQVIHYRWYITANVWCVV